MTPKSQQQSQILNPHPEYVAAGCGYGKSITHKGYRLFGWGFPPVALKWYRQIVNNIKNGTIVEVGVYGGASIFEIQDICLNNKIQVYGIDPWEDQDFSKINGTPVKAAEINKIKRNMKYARLNLEDIVNSLKYKNIIILKSTSDKEASRFDDKSLDLVYIDGDHSYNFVYNDMTIWIDKIKPGNLLCGDDFGWASVRKAVTDFSSKYKLDLNNVQGKWYIKVK